MESSPESSADSSSRSDSTPRLLWLRIWCSISALALLGVTYRLWFPSPEQTYPLIPLFEAFCDSPRWMDWVAAIGLCLGWLAFWKWPRWGGVVVIACGLLCLLLDQHRIQPWHFQLLIFAFVFLVGSGNQRLMWLRVFVISIYCYSAMGKFDFEFLHSIGPQFLKQLMSFVSVDNQEISPSFAASLPACELLLAAGLAVPALRSIAACGMSLVHLGLIAILGPFGLNHSPGVVLWNFHFAVLVLLLFFRVQGDTKRNETGTEASPNSEESSSQWLSNYCVAAILIPVMVLPLVERFGLWDHWPSWALYAPHSSRTDVQVASHRVSDLPADLAELVPDVDEGTLWASVPISQWSLQATGVPVYPQARYQLGLAMALAQSLDSEFETRVRILGPAARWDGKRTAKFAEGLSKIRRAQDSFWLNAKPRRSRGGIEPESND